MNSFESNGPESRPSFPAEGAEHEPSPKGFRVEIEDPEGIYEQIKIAAQQWSLGKAPLEKPFEDFAVHVKSDGKVFEVNTWISTEEIMGPKALVRLDERIISEKLKTKKIGKRLLVLGEKGKPEYEINLEKWGSGSGIFSAGTSLSTVERRPVGDFESFKKELERLAKITETVVEAAYKKVNKEPPDVTLVFRPPRRIGPRGFLETERLRDIVRERITVEKPKIKFEEIGGQKEAKREIQSLAFALTNPKLYQKWGTRPPKGILLAGPPGNGKTLLAKALAAQTEAKFFHVEVSDIVSKWYGEAEQLMKAVFEEASKATGKTIIFFDELDAIAPRRGESHEASGKIVSTMLENIDGLEANPDILVVAATNRPEAIDHALLRPGRFDRIVEVPLPDKEGRKEILAIHIKKAEQIAERKLFADFGMEKTSEETKEFSGADLAEIVRRVLEEKVRLEGGGKKPGLVTTEELSKIVESYERVRETKRKLGFV